MPLGGRTSGATRVCLLLGGTYTRIFSKKTLASAQKPHHHERISISLDEKERDTQEIYQQEKEAIRARRYKGTIPTEPVDVSDSLAGVLSTMTS
jgi:hypothetical protein